MSHIKPKNHQKQVLTWFDRHGRKTLPWQQDKTPYRVWVSEIMLQQTQVSTVIPYFERFMQRFPDLASLAAAEQDDVLHFWTGLGYYTRARNLHRSAKIIMNEHHGVFPQEIEALQTLPGIGQSTAGAIRAIAFQQHAPILDGNVKRVLTRLLGITTWPGEKKVHAQLWDVATQLTPHQRVADYTQAMMDIGATLCTRSKPQCETCPLKKNCIAFEKNIAASLPRKKPKKKIPVRDVTLVVLKNNDTVLLEKRANSGVWGGLWSLPEITGHALQRDVKTFCTTQFNMSVAQIQFGEIFRHTFSHFHLDILPVFVHIKKNVRKRLEADKQIWYNVSHPDAVGLPAPVKRLLDSGERDVTHRELRKTRKAS